MTDKIVDHLQFIQLTADIQNVHSLFTSPMRELIMIFYCIGFCLVIFFFTTASRTLLGPTELLIQCIPGALSLEIRRPWHEADNLPPSSTEDKNLWSYTSTPPIRIHGVVIS